MNIDPTVSTEFYRRSTYEKAIRHVAYGLDRDEVLELLEQRFPGAPWQEDWVVCKTRVVGRGLPASWVRGPRRLDPYY